ncbi:uncharacterized protein F5891DRAFT_986599 [Suillus fuscotomentosus]|uniref:Uncharacterized protein n=1 Tax=Suillus fuscotomentosus TaxID=1912939 RepID=A0AAD4DRJ0_9AGAM|nr:uncharacterized protein F5891DRAFT_986599 [Suillus fuscotomentosus]KAG1891726.1 hypothetical protein F5891DRAFT_986599 [Suillus fuscotomentosus]
MTSSNSQVPAASNGMTSGTNSHVPAASIVGPSSGDLIAALFTQLNISSNNAASLTSVLQGVIQNAVVAAIQEVATAAQGVTIAAHASTIPPVATAPSVITPHTIPLIATTLATTAITSTPPLVTAPPVVTAATYTWTHLGVIYIIPEPNSVGPFYWINHGRRIGVVATWQQTSSYVTGGIRLIEEAIDRGDTEVIK